MNDQHCWQQLCIVLVKRIMTDALMDITIFMSLLSRRLVYIFKTCKITVNLPISNLSVDKSFFSQFEGQKYRLVL